MGRPKELLWFVALQLLSICLGLYQIFKNWDVFVQQTGATLGSDAVQVIVAVSYGLLFILTFLIWNRNNIARWAYILIGLAGFLMGLGKLTGADAVSLFQTALSMATVVLLLLRPVRDWFATKDILDRPIL